MPNTTPWQVNIRRDTKANWVLRNPILLDQEIGLETDTRKFKIGNGITPWNLSPYGTLSGPNGVLVFISTAAENRLTYGPDGGLFVPEMVADPLAYYLLAKS